MQPSNVQYVSFCGEDFVQGGLFDNVDVAIREIVFTKDLPSEEYRSDVPVFFAHAFLDSLEDTGTVLEGWWSCGSVKDHQIIDDEGNPAGEGHRVSGPSLMKGSNFYHLIISMESNGFPKELTRSADLRSLITSEIHLERKAIAREGLKNAPRADGRAGGTQVLLCTKLIHYPGEKRVAKAKPAAAAGATRPAAAAAARPAAAAAATRPTATTTTTTTTTPIPIPTAAPEPVAKFDAAAMAIQVVSDIMELHPGGISLAEAKIEASRALSQVHKVTLRNRNETVAIMFDPAWLAEQGVAIETLIGVENLVLLPV